jgi:hypothetical protein
MSGMARSTGSSPYERCAIEQPDDPVGDRLGDLGQVEQEWQVGGVAAFLMVGDDLVDEVVDGGRVAVGRGRGRGGDSALYP